MSAGTRAKGHGSGGRALLAGASAVRVGYGAAALLAPEAMGRARLAPDTHGLAEPRLLSRGFGAHQLLIGGFGLYAAVRGRRLARGAAALGALIDGSDVLAAALELGAPERARRVALGGIAISGTGALALVAALRALGNSPAH